MTAMLQAQPNPGNLFGLLSAPSVPEHRPGLENCLLALAVVAMAAGFALFSVESWNQALFLSINQAFSGLTPDQRALLTVLGDGSVAACLAIGVFIRNPRALAYIFLAAVLAGILIQVPKHWFDAARPPAVLDMALFDVVGKAYKSNSFPSGHSGTAWLAAALVALSIRQRLVTLGVLGLGALGALSRIMVGVHWPADVMAGSSIGIFVAVFIYRQFAGRPVEIARWGQWLLAVLLLLVSVNGFLHNTGYEQYQGVTAFRWIASGLAAGAALFLFAQLLWPVAEWVAQRLFKESASRALSRVFKFGMVGGSGFVVDMTLYALFYSWLGMNLLVARSIAYWLTSSWNWYLNRVFTFKDADNDRKRVQWAKYLLMCLISFVPSMGTFYGLTTSVPFFAEHSQLALILGVIAGALFNYVVAGFLIFKVYGKD
ncbi:phosphatase PAP2 family protein [Simiduia agarivorans]|uniref:Glycosyltransferase n=1 Tax=Simiduia agarivorans (strain DSM 21679 / JCM 13881 / BCRC 17597 / SA1) TaxID=1117647 RepID=K4L3V5_SIMAS|nr:phosphatase PAP2 family protein [Simiduia agarivorans]AFV00893.1 glycosyltransferase [Simiduia agarivorans SA1 = DSM 21679]